MVAGSTDSIMESEQVCGLKIVPLECVDINNAAARLQSRGNVSDNNIFEILPRFSVGPGEETSNWEQLYTRRRDEVLAATGGGDATGIAVGNDLIVFERDKDEPSRMVHFSDPIDFMVWRRSILLVGLSSSEIILVDPNTFNFKYSRKTFPDTQSDGRFYVDAFIHSNPDPTKIDVVLVSRNGMVFVFPDVCLSDGRLDATHDQNVSLDVDIGTIKEVSMFNFDNVEEIVCAASPSRNKVIVLEKCGRAIIAELSDSIPEFTSTFVSNNLFSNLSLALFKSGVVPRKLVCFDGILFLLLSNGTLEIFSGGELLAGNSLNLPQASMAIHDFKLVSNNNEGSVKLWTLYGKLSSTSSPENYIGIFSGPQFLSEFYFQLPVLSSKGEPCPYFKFPSNISPFEEPTSIVEMASNDVRFYHVLETSTDVTLQKLLSRGKYGEAMDLALQYNKDLDIVRKAEARDKLNRLSVGQLTPEGKHASELLYLELLDVLKKINDAEFVCNFCVNANLQKIPWVKEILALGKTRVQECSNAVASRSLLLTLKKFYTFELVYPSGSISEWNTFVSRDNTMFFQCLKFLKNGNFDKCERVWRRHSEEFTSGITLQEFLPFFHTLFEHQLKTTTSVSLFRTVLPYAVEKVALSAASPDEKSDCTGTQELNVLINLIIRQVCTLEGMVHWPTNALNFIKILSSVIKDEMKRLEDPRLGAERITASKKKIVKKISAKLEYIIQVLEELADLKRNHSIRILFQDYTMSDIPEVINKLLYKLLSKEEVERFVSEYLCPYAERKRLNVDQLFAEHIKSVLQHIHYYIQAINIPHEERIVCLVNLISSTKTKLECVLHISEEWPVPWTVGIDNMVKHILDSHNRAGLSSECVQHYDTITIMRKRVPYRCVLNKYKLNDSKLCISKCYITMSLIRILMMKKPGYHEDCKKLLENIPGLDSSLDEFRLEYVESILRLYDKSLGDEQIFPENVQPENVLKKAVIKRVFMELQLFEENSHEFEEPGDVEEHHRLISIFNLLGAESNDPRITVVAALKRLLPTISLNAIYQPEFPYVILSKLCEDLESSPSFTASQLIEECKKLSRITQAYLPDLLLAIGAYFVQDGHSGNSEALLWFVVEYIVKTPLNIDMNNSLANQELLQSASLAIARSLMQLCPTLSLEQMNILQEFLCRVGSSFDGMCIEVAHQLCFFRIFLSLKEQEIPLEQEFLDIYKWMGGESKNPEIIKAKIRVIGETLLKFGETDLYSSIFKTIKRHLFVFIQFAQDHVVKYYVGVANDIERIKTDLSAKTSRTTEENVESRMRKLVYDLNEVGIRVNVYALKIRNKVTLLEKLLKLKNYTLAAELAIVFNFYKEHSIWSHILSGFLTTSNSNELQRVLESIRTVPELWMLPEFAEAWKKVSETNPNFYDLCPIPLT